MAFPSSIWTTILEIRRDRSRVQEEVVLLYRAPVAGFIRSQGVDDKDVEDLAQEVFMRVCGDGFLEKVDPSKGRFRSLLITVTRHVIDSFRRRELAAQRDRRREVSLDETIDIPSEPVDEPAFDRLWATNLMTQAMKRLSEDPAMAALRFQLEGQQSMSRSW